MLQIQPKWEQGSQWIEFADRNGLTFEAAEPYMPPVLGSSKQRDCELWHGQSRRVTAIHGAFVDVNVASGDPLFRELSRRRCRESCLLARELGTDRVVFHGSAVTFLRGGYLEIWSARCAEYYEKLAEEYDVRIYLENSQDLDPVPLRAVMEQIRGDRVSVCLDLAHAQYSRAPLAQWFEELGSWIGYLHLSDNLGQFDDHLVLGQGVVDWQQADALWRQLPQQEIPMTLEVADLAGTEQSLAFLRERGYFGLGGV